MKYEVNMCSSEITTEKVFLVLAVNFNGHISVSSVNQDFNYYLKELSCNNYDYSLFVCMCFGGAWSWSWDLTYITLGNHSTTNYMQIFVCLLSFIASS